MADSDWARYFLPAIEYLLRGVDLYQYVYTVNPPWMYVLLAPIGWLPQQAALWAGAIMPVVALVYASWKVRKPYLIALVGISFPFIELCVYGNLDWMVMLGALHMNNALSPFLLTVKPQAGALAVFAQLGKMRGQSWKAYVRLFAPFVLISIPLLLLYPGFFQYASSFNTRLAEVQHFSLFPYTLPLVPPLVWLAYRRRDPLYGVLASLCLSPYFLFYSLVPSLFFIGKHSWKWGLAANLLTWVIFALVLLGVITIRF